MALITCLECEKQVSDKADSCPNCGFPITKNTLNTVTCFECECVYPIYKKECPNCSYGNHKYKLTNRHESMEIISPTSSIKKVPTFYDHQEWGKINKELICPHCQRKGSVNTKKVERKKGVSGAKATGALLTGGISMLVTGLSRKEDMTQAHCQNCNSTWEF